MPDGEKFVHLIVSDTGKGIPESEMTNIFAPFYQIEDGRSKDKVGTGIGLSLTQSIVELHHGIIWVEKYPRHPHDCALNGDADKGRILFGS